MHKGIVSFWVILLTVMTLACTTVHTIPVTEEPTPTASLPSTTAPAHVPGVTATVMPSSPTSDPTATPLLLATVPPTPNPTPTNTPIYGKVLSSGISVADVIDGVLPGVVQIIVGSSTGTGFITSSTGMVLTNKHVIEGSDRVTVRMVSGQRYGARVTYRHPSLDVAPLAD